MNVDFFNKQKGDTKVKRITILISILLCLSIFSFAQENKEKVIINDRGETSINFFKRAVKDAYKSDWEFYFQSVDRDLYFYNTKRIKRNNKEISVWTKIYFFNRANAIDDKELSKFLIENDVNYALIHETLFCGSERSTAHSISYYSRKDEQISSEKELNLSMDISPDSSVAMLYDKLCGNAK